MWSWTTGHLRRSLRHYDLRHEWPRCLSTTFRHGGTIANARFKFLNFVRGREHWTHDLTEAELIRICLRLQEDNELP